MAGRAIEGGAETHIPCSTSYDVVNIVPVLQMKKQAWGSKGNDCLRPYSHGTAEEGLNPGLLISSSDHYSGIEPRHDRKCHMYERHVYVGSRFYGQSITTVSNLNATVSRNFKLW